MKNNCRATDSACQALPKPVRVISTNELQRKWRNLCLGHRAGKEPVSQFGGNRNGLALHLLSKKDGIFSSATLELSTKNSVKFFQIGKCSMENC